MLGLPEDFADRSVCILGLGYVGLTLATVMAEAGFRIVGVEIRDDVLEGLREGRPHFYEPSSPFPPDTRDSDSGGASSPCRRA